jgi:hypothetical protein
MPMSAMIRCHAHVAITPIGTNIITVALFVRQIKLLMDINAVVQKTILTGIM